VADELDEALASVSELPLGGVALDWSGVGFPCGFGWSWRGVETATEIIPVQCFSLGTTRIVTESRAP